MAQELSKTIGRRLERAASALGAANPKPDMAPMLGRTFYLPADDPRYGANELTPGGPPFLAEFAERPGILDFAIEPLGPGASPGARRDEVTREVRRLIQPNFGEDALYWFDRASEEWRGFSSPANLRFGAWFQGAYDKDGLKRSTVHYELVPSQLRGLPMNLSRLVDAATHALPTLQPLFTTISCERDEGTQRATFVHRGMLRLANLEPLMTRLGLAHHLPTIMQIVGLALGGRFELPQESVLLGLRSGARGPEMEIEVSLRRVPDVPEAFLRLLSLALSEQPAQLRAMSQWLEAFAPGEDEGSASITSMRIRVTSEGPAMVSLHLRPVEFEIKRQMAESLSAAAAR